MRKILLLVETGGTFKTATLPFAAHGDTLPVTRIEPAYEGRGEARHENGIKVTVLLPFDAFASVPVTIPGVDVTNFPSNDVITERNMALRFLMGKFKNLVISFPAGITELFAIVGRQAD